QERVHLLLGHKALHKSTAGRRVAAVVEQRHRDLQLAATHVDAAGRVCLVNGHLIALLKVSAGGGERAGERKDGTQLDLRRRFRRASRRWPRGRSASRRCSATSAHEQG